MLDIQPWLQALLDRNQLDTAYVKTIQRWFSPLARELAAYQASSGRPVLIAINGSQGSGKTTLCDYLCSSLREDYGRQCIALSLDDFYLTRAERKTLANAVHPLFMTRGVPGTHDMSLLQSTLDKLLNGNGVPAVDIPRFDKANDERKPARAWDRVTTPLDFVFLEGWCLGVTAEDKANLRKPINALEREEDPHTTWRTRVNNSLSQFFLPLYQRVDQWIMLQAPSFDCVFDWRRQQEQQLAQKTGKEKALHLMDDANLRRFIQHYERLTKRCLAELPAHVHYLLQLDETRHIISCKRSLDSGQL